MRTVKLAMTYMAKMKGILVLTMLTLHAITIMCETYRRIEFSTEVIVQCDSCDIVVCTNSCRRPCLV